MSKKMRQTNGRTNEEQLELFANLLEPAAEIIADKEVAAILKGKGKAITAVKLAIKNHKSAVIELLAVLDGVPVEDYIVPNPAALTMKLINLLNSEEMKDLFTLPGQTNAAASSGSAMDNTKGGAN